MINNDNEKLNTINDPFENAVSETEIETLSEEELKQLDINYLKQNKVSIEQNLHQECEKLQTNIDYFKSLLQAAIYVKGEDGVSIFALKRLTQLSAVSIHYLLNEWSKDLELPSSGLILKRFGTIYKLVTKPELYEKLIYLAEFKTYDPLTPRLFEVLAIIAYNQPCTKNDIELIYGKDPKYCIDRLITLNLVEIMGNSNQPGSPYLYGTSQNFLDKFNLRSLSQLPKVDFIANNSEDILDLYNSNNPDFNNDDNES